MLTELKKIPAKLYSPLKEDMNPDSENLIGKRIVWVSGNNNLFGRVLRVYNKHVLISLEKKWMKRVRWTVNWTHLYLVPEEDTEKIEKEKLLREKAKAEKMEELQDHMKKIIKYHSVAIPSKVIVDNEQQKYAENLLREYSLFKEYVEEFQVLKFSLLSMYADIKILYQKCIDNGISKDNIPDIPMSIEVLLDINKNAISKKANKEKRKNLNNVRSATRFMLTNLLVAAGEDGLTSEDIIETIEKTFHEDSKDESCAITSHRIMGMLSSLSRRKEAESIDGKKWRATEKLNFQQRSFFVYEN